MPIQPLGALPAIPSAVPTVGTDPFGQALSSIGQGLVQGFAERPQVQMQRTAQQFALLNDINNFRQGNLKNLEGILQYLPPSRSTPVIQQIIASLGNSGIDPSMAKNLGIDPSVLALFSGVRNNGGFSTPAPANPNATLYGQPGQPAPTQQPGQPTNTTQPGQPTQNQPAPQDTTTVLDFGSWLQKTYGIGPQDVPPAYAQMYDTQYNSYVSAARAQIQLRGQAQTQREAILTAAQKTGATSEDIGPQVDAFNAQYGQQYPGLQIDKNAILAGMTKRWTTAKIADVRAQFNDQTKGIQTAIASGSAQAARDAAQRANLLAANAKKYLHADFGQVMTPDQAAASAIASPAYQRLIVDKQRLAVETQNAATSAARLAQTIVNDVNANNRAALTINAANGRAVLADLRSRLTSLETTRRSLTSDLDTVANAIKGAKKGQDTTALRARLTAIQNDLTSTNAALASAQTSQSALERSLTGAGAPPTPKLPKITVPRQSYTVGGKTLTGQQLAQEIQNDLAGGATVAQEVAILKKYKINPKDFGL